MAETVTNLKVRFGADTKNFKADLESGKAAVTNFTGAASGAFGEFAALFGVDMGMIQGQLAATNKSLALLSGGFKGATAGAGLFSNALKVLRLALISTGIGAIIVALGSLVTYFTKTERGAEAVERVMASFKAVVNVLIDRFAILGEGIYKLFTGDFKGGWDAMKKSVKDIGTEIVTESKAARELEIALQKLEDKEIALIEVQGKRRQAIAELRLAAKDEEKSTKEKMAAMSEAIALQRQVTADEVALQAERTRILEAQTKMGEVMDEDNRALAESRATLNDLEAQGNDTIRGMMREYNKLSKEVNAQAEALDKETAAIRLNEIAKEKAESKNMDRLSPIKLTADSKTGKITETTLAAPKAEGFETDKLSASADKIKSIYGDLKTTVMDFSQVFQESMTGIAVGFGESLGNMLAGTGTLSDLGNVVLTSLADLAIQVGKIAIGVGLATFGIKAALQSLNPVLAIAAGVALVALGSAAKGALSGASSGGTYSSASTSSYGSGVSSSGSAGSLRSAPMTIYIEGEFRQRGPDLVATINKNYQRRVIGT